MARFEITGPDGARYEITAPEGATEDQIMRFAQEQIASGDLKATPSIDFNAPVAEVRKQIAALPPKERKAARRQWADAYVAKERKEGGVGQFAGSVVRNLARGTPIGSWLDEANAGTNAMLYRAGLGGAPYEETVEYNRAQNRADDATSTRLGSLPLIGDVTVGGVQKLAGGIASAPFAPAARLAQGTTFLPRAVNYGATGAGYGALYGAGEGEDAASRTQNAMYGAAVGAGIGAGAAAVQGAAGAVTQGVRDRIGRPMPPELQGYDPRAVRGVSEAVRQDGITPNRLVHAAVPNDQGTFTALGPQGMIADLGQNVSSLAGGIMKRQGTGSSIAATAIRDRRRGAQTRINQALDRTVGPRQDVVTLRDQAVRDANAAAAPFYDQFYQTPMTATPALRQTMRQIKELSAGRTAFTRARELMKADGVQPSQSLGQFWDYIKRGLDDAIAKTKPGTNERRVLTRRKNELIAEVDRILSPQNPAASPWAKARALAGDGKQYEEGLEYGASVLGKKLSPDQMRADMGRFSPVAQLGAREGMRNDIRNVMETAVDRFGQQPTGGIRQIIGPQAREKIAMAAGGGRYASGVDPQSPVLQTSNPTRATSMYSPPQDLARTVEAESWFNRLYEKSVQNSQANANANAQRLLPPQPGEAPASRFRGAGIPGLVAEFAAGIVNFVRRGALTERNDRVVADMARLLVAQGAERNQIVAGLLQLANNQQITAQHRQTIESIARTIVEGSRQQAVSQTTNQ